MSMVQVSSCDLGALALVVSDPPAPEENHHFCGKCCAPLIEAGRKYCSPVCVKEGNSRLLKGGRSHPRWRGGIIRTADGYVSVTAPDHPNANANGRVAEHRLVMEKHLGRHLWRHENVHHKNGIRSDNRLANLELWVKPQPAGQRPEDLAEWVVATYPGLVAEAAGTVGRIDRDAL